MTQIIVHRRAAGYLSRLPGHHRKNQICTGTVEG